MKEQIEALKKSPVFAMSLGSKELFHSNFWAWIMEQDKSFALWFFDLERDLKVEKITREEKNREITVHIDSKEYIIENKFKSIPAKEQLEAYKCEKGVLVALEKPEWDLPQSWDFRSYDDIIDKLEALCLDSVFYKEIIEEYIRVLKNLICVIRNATKKDELLHIDSQGQLSGLRIWDICQKASAEKLVSFLDKSEKIAELRGSLEEDLELVIWSGFTHAQVLVDARIIRKSDRAKIGVQIQGNQYRKMAEYVSSTNKDRTEEVWKDFKKSAWFGEKPPRMRKEKCTYKGKEKVGNKEEYYSFVYQHYEVESYSFESLLERIVNDLNIAKKKI